MMKVDRPGHSKWVRLYLSLWVLVYVSFTFSFKFQTLCVVLTSRLIIVLDFVACSRLISVSNLWLVIMLFFMLF
jgi:hypothetical protein